MGFDNKNERLCIFFVVGISRFYDIVLLMRFIWYEEVSIDFFYLYFICLVEWDEELDLFVGNFVFFWRIFIWFGFVKWVCSVFFFLCGVLMFL